MASGWEPPKTKKTKKTKKLEVFLRVLDFQKFAKRRARNTKDENNENKMTKNEKKRKNEKTVLAKNRPFWWPPRFSEGRGNHQKGKTIGKNERKKRKKELEVFTCFLDFPKMGYFRPFWWPPRLSGGRAGNLPKWKLWEPFPTRTSARETLGLPEAPKWNLWETSAILVMILVMFLVISKMIINRINK